MKIAQRDCAELVGDGDLLRPWGGSSLDSILPTRVEWQVLQPTTAALLDRRFVRAASEWPEVLSALTLRAITRAQSLAVALAISCITGLEVRVLALLWHLADRWGVVRPEGVVLRLRLTHGLIAQLLGASRPSVTTALRQLESEGLIAKHRPAGWLLRGDPPKQVRVAHARRQATGRGPGGSREHARR